MKSPIHLSALCGAAIALCSFSFSTLAYRSDNAYRVKQHVHEPNAILAAY